MGVTVIRDLSYPTAMFCLAALSVGCAKEHSQERLAVAANDCQVCHASEYSTAVSPPHEGILPRECFLCHSNDQWSPSFFEHSIVSDRECVICHQQDYDQATDPVHTGVFPTTCQDCHFTEAWRPAVTGEHPEDQFPISEGAHRPVGCAECHDLNRGLVPGADNTNCVGCHTGEHAQERVTSQHKEVAGFDFKPDEPNFCLLCHPDGRK